MGGGYFVISVGSDQHQVAHVGPDQEILDHITRCRIQPPQIIEKQRKRMLRLSENGDESTDHSPPKQKSSSASANRCVGCDLLHAKSDDHARG